MKKKKNKKDRKGLEKGWGYLYVVNGGDRVKVGMSLQPMRRVKSVKSGAGLDRECRFQIYGPVPNVKNQEQYILDNLPCRVPGSEWFRMSYEDCIRRMEYLVVTW